MKLTTKWIMEAIKAIQDETCIYAVEEIEHWYQGAWLKKTLAYSFDKRVFRILHDQQDVDKVFSFLALHGANRIEWEKVDKLLYPSEPALAMKLDKIPSMRRDNKSYIVCSEFIFSKNDLLQLPGKDSVLLVQVDRNYGYLIVYDEFENIIGICCGQNRRIRT